MPDITYKCVDCEKEFTFTEGEQNYFKDRGLAIPKRCEACRIKRRSVIGRNQVNIPVQEEKESKK